MNSNDIVVSADCACDLTENLIKKYGISVISFYINYKKSRFRDIDEITAGTLAEYLERQDEIISSSPPDINEYREYFKRISENGRKQVIHISISENLSIAYKNAIDGSKNLDYVHVISSGSASNGTGLLVLAAADYASRSGDVESILSDLEKIRSKVNCGFILRSTQQLANNRRMNQFVSNMLTFFRIKPMIKIENNDLRINGIYIGNRESYAREFVRKTLKRKRNILDDILFISVSGCSEEIQHIVYDEATKLVPWKKIYVADVSATCLCNIGTHSIGMMFFKK